MLLATDGWLPIGGAGPPPRHREQSGLWRVDSVATESILLPTKDQTDNLQVVYVRFNFIFNRILTKITNFFDKF